MIMAELDHLHPLYATTRFYYPCFVLYCFKGATSLKKNSALFLNLNQQRLCLSPLPCIRLYFHT